MVLLKVRRDALRPRLGRAEGRGLIRPLAPPVGAAGAFVEHLHPLLLLRLPHARHRTRRMAPARCAACALAVAAREGARQRHQSSRHAAPKDGAAAAAGGDAGDGASAAVAPACECSGCAALAGRDCRARTLTTPPPSPASRRGHPRELVASSARGRARAVRTCTPRVAHRTQSPRRGSPLAARKRMPAPPLHVLTCRRTWG
eukprot:scaffold420_cov404-Prasinococcus_capsulatus_cf.AAC.5